MLLSFDDPYYKARNVVVLGQSYYPQSSWVLYLLLRHACATIQGMGEELLSPDQNYEQAIFYNPEKEFMLHVFCLY